jgi:uncharacterized protein
MTLLLTMLPIYLLGNLHCIGMCGPLVMMIGKHRFRYFYFFGRILSFSLAGMAAGEVGVVLNIVLQRYHIPALSSFIFGGIIVWIGILSLLGWSLPGQDWLGKRLANTNRSLSLLMLKDQPLSTFLFGFFTIALPCGQTLIVFSACALSGDLFVGLLNGFAFALLTSPSLLFAMHAHNLLKRIKQHYNKIMGVCAIFIGTLALCRGLAELDFIDHFILNPDSSPQYHVVIY